MSGVTITAERRLLDHSSSILAGDVLAFPFRAVRKALAAETAETIAVARTTAEIEALERPWRALETSAARCSHAFQSYDWCRAWIRSLASERESPYVVTVRRGSELRLVWPLMRTRVGPITVLRWLSDPFCQYGDVIAAGSEPEVLIARAWRWIAENVGADVVRLRHVRQDAVAHGFLAGRFRTSGETACAPFMDLTAFACESAYEARYSKEQRRRRKRIRGELEAFGPLNFSLIEDGARRDQAIEQAVAAKRAWLAERGLHSRPLASGELPAFLRDLGRADRNLRLVISVLSAGARDVAFEIGLRFKQRHYGFITAHDLTLTDASPARLHMDLSQRRAVSDGVSIFDLMVPGDPHKASWSSGSVPVRDFHAGLTLAGGLYCKAYLEVLRPSLRAAYQGARPSLRRQVSRLVS